MTLNETLLFIKNSVLTKADKMKICEELGIEATNKTQEIINQILVLMREERSIKSEWNEEDAKNFFRICSYSIYNKMKDYLELENRNFINYLIEYYDNKYQIMNKLYKKYSLSPADREHIKVFENLKRFIEETSIDFAIRNQRIALCKNSLIAQLGEFKRMFLEEGAKFAENEWMGQKTPLWSLEDYIKMEVDNRERYYNFAMLSLAERLVRNGVDENNIKVNYIQEDYKLFEMVIEDGKSTWHARTIIAAKYSTIVNCHLRFIITKTK